MLLKLSTKLGLATLGPRAFGARDTTALGGIEVTEFSEYTDRAMIDDAHELLRAPLARTETIVIETRKEAR